MSTYAEVVISPMTATSPVVVADSQATRAIGSCSRIASRMASEIWSHILSGCPSVTDSEVKKSFSALHERVTHQPLPSVDSGLGTQD